MEGHLFAYNEYANEQNTKGLLYLKFRCTWRLEVICKRDIPSKSVSIFNMYEDNHAVND